MKLLIASDIHGSYYYAKLLFERYLEEKADKLILLGDLLYHGPRNDLPKGYEPKNVIELLNQHKDEILTVRGNCEAEVDQMVLDFPCMAEYMIFYDNNRMMYATHGHKCNPDKLPPLKEGDVLLNGHTHISALENKGKYYYVNPGSVSIPKNNTTNSYIIYEDSQFILKNIVDGKVINKMKL